MGSPNSLDIVAVARLCAEVSAYSSALFEFCGRQIAVSDPGPKQRWWARACHQHAWHIELATERMPTVPVVDARALVAGAGEPLGAMTNHDSDVPAVDPIPVWQQATAEICATLDAGNQRLDPALDPSTSRMIDLVRADLARLADELASAL